MKLESSEQIALVESCRKGDRKAQYELYCKYNAAMFNVCLRIVQNREEAEDILQECFIDIFNKLNSWRAEASLGSWIKRIVVNRSINHVKRKKIVLVDDTKLVNKAEIEEEEEMKEEFPFTVDQVKTAMHKLSDGYRLVFTLYLFEDFSHKEIAEQLNISESTSKSQLNRAKKKLIVLFQNNNKFDNN